jgi:hypothetical protein
VQALCWVVWTAQQCGWDQCKHCAGGVDCSTVWLLRGRTGQSESGICGGTAAGRRVAWGGMKCEPCSGWRGVRDNVLLGRGALGSLGEVAVGYGGNVLHAPWNGIQCGRGRVVLGGVECAALRVVCRELRGIMRTFCGQQQCWCKRCGSHRGGGVV